MHTIQYYANLANKILENNTDYIKSKKVIYSFFEPKNENLKLEDISLRLTVINSLYSTQMEKRLFGINDLAEKILIVSEKSDLILIKMINLFLQNNNEKNIINLLETKYGINKQGKEGGLAISLLSKYFYFLLKFQFPIYDSLVRDYLPKINNRFKIMDRLNINSANNYFEKLSLFNTKSNIKDYNKLDNLCWLYGKINRGSFSLILNKREYLELINIITVTPETVIDDEQIVKYLKNNKSDLSSLFTEKQSDFIAWAITE